MPIGRRGIAARDTNGTSNGSPGKAEPGSPRKPKGHRCKTPTTDPGSCPHRARKCLPSGNGHAGRRATGGTRCRRGHGRGRVVLAPCRRRRRCGDALRRSQGRAVAITRSGRESCRAAAVDGGRSRRAGTPGRRSCRPPAARTQARSWRTHPGAAGGTACSVGTPSPSPHRVCTGAPCAHASPVTASTGRADTAHYSRGAPEPVVKKTTWRPISSAPCRDARQTLAHSRLGRIRWRKRAILLVSPSIRSSGGRRPL